MIRWYVIGGLAVTVFFAFNGMKTKEISQSPLSRELSERPSLYLENAVMNEFDSLGRNEYTISSVEIRQNAATGQSTLIRPFLTFHAPGNAPWYMHSELGVFGLQKMNQTTATKGVISSKQSIHLSGRVRLSRSAGDPAFIRFQSNSMTIFPGLKRVQSNDPVIIETSSSNVRAASFECDLEQSHMQLRSSIDQRVHVVIHPKTRI